MKKFNFNLASLLKVRHLKEEIAHRNLLEAHLILQKMSMILEKFHRDFDRVTDHIRVLQKNNVHPQSLTMNYDYLEVLKKKIDHQRIIVREAQAILELRRREVMKAMQKRKIIENLRDKKYGEWETLNLNVEKNALDELATMRYPKTKRQFE